MSFGRKLVASCALAVTTSLALAACGDGGAQQYPEYAEALPALDGLTLQVNPDAEAAEDAAALAVGESVEGLALDEAALAQAAPEYLTKARTYVRAVNAALREHAATVRALLEGTAGDMQPGDVVVYGPQDRALATFKLSVKKLAPGRFAWKLEARPLGSTDAAAWKVVSAGRVARGLEEGRSRGTLGVHLDNLKAVAPSAPGQGRLMASFAHVGESKMLAFRLAGFTPDVAQVPAVTAAFVGHRVGEARLTRVRLAAPFDVEGSATEAKEHVFARLRFIPGVGGRADLRAVGGDVPETQVYLAAACWDAREAEVFKVLRLCTRSSTGPVDCQVVRTSGTVQACPHAELRAAEVEAPEADAADTTPEAGAVEAPEAPPMDVMAAF